MIPISELMRRGATAYESAEADEELGMLADKAKAVADTLNCLRHGRRLHCRCWE